MEKFIGTKIVQAEPAWLVFNEPGEPGEVVVQDHDLELTTAKTVLNGYKVIYEDGYESWSPREVFEKCYRRIDGMNFGLALEAAKMGNLSFFITPYTQGNMFLIISSLISGF